MPHRIGRIRQRGGGGGALDMFRVLRIASISILVIAIAAVAVAAAGINVTGGLRVGPNGVGYRRSPSTGRLFLGRHHRQHQEYCRRLVLFPCRDDASLVITINKQCGVVDRI